ncbi:fluoride efflux transporter CrcB [Paludibacter sp. 221]|uniref:fluoride efflux transporter CrcB n=1 Tax=Paludibacter sp. 221 TaxID=2302939 RepID=UPI0013D0DBB1|nr:fluoride efflux transporter CrcB [Paludibacter sp. 221]NDV45858.1 fluoride efflux transporter CrcB [Paludibacter sp. 221]
MIRAIILVGIGGGVGSILRYLTNVVVEKYFHSHFPLATFIVNMIGSFLIGLIFGLFIKQGLVNQDLKHLLIAGFCGGFTTFSAFALENFNLFHSGQPMLAFAYIAASVVLSLFFVWLGMLLFNA